MYIYIYIYIYIYEFDKITVQEQHIQRQLVFFFYKDHLIPKTSMKRYATLKPKDNSYMVSPKSINSVFSLDLYNLWLARPNIV